MSKKARTASTGEPARLVEEIARLEALLEGNPSWVAWRQLEEKMATGQGPEPQIVGALVGAYAMALAADPNYIAFLKARYAFRQLAERPGGSPAPARSKAPPAPEPREERAVTILPASHFPPPEPEPLRPAPRPEPRDATAAPIDAEWVPAPPPPGPTPQPRPTATAMGDSENARSLLARLTELERQATIVEEAASPIVTPAAKGETPAIEEAEVTIVLDEADDARPTASSGLVSRLDSLTRERTAGGRATARAKTDVDEAAVEIVEDPVEKG
jgi:hypothetical protein